MRYLDYIARFERHRSLGQVETYAQVQEGGQAFPLLRFTVPGRRWLVVTSGFHGDEVAGPLTLLEHLEELVSHARARDVGLRVYPCANPSGFEDGTRYNRSGERPNNDFLRYEVAPGVLCGELGPSQTYHRWCVFEDGPQETRALRQDLERLPPPDAALDIHQDPYMPDELAYAYVFGDRSAYLPLLEAAAAHAVIARSMVVDNATKLSTDEDGLIDFRDGSVTDYFDRRGTRWTAALETTVSTPMARSHAINLAWLHGFIDLAAQ